MDIVVPDSDYLEMVISLDEQAVFGSLILNTAVVSPSYHSGTVSWIEPPYLGNSDPGLSWIKRLPFMVATTFSVVPA